MKTMKTGLAAALILACCLGGEIAHARRYCGGTMGGLKDTIEVTGDCIAETVAAPFGTLSDITDKTSDKAKMAQAYVAVREEAIGFVQADGKVEITQMLQEVMADARKTIAKEFGDAAAQELTPVQYGQIVVMAANELQQP